MLHSAENLNETRHNRVEGRPVLDVAERSFQSLVTPEGQENIGDPTCEPANTGARDAISIDKRSSAKGQHNQQ